jgi:hypothetical protein
MNLFSLFTDFYFNLFLHCNPNRSFFLLCFIKTRPFVKRKPVKTGGKITGTIAFRFRQVLLYMQQMVRVERFQLKRTTGTFCYRYTLLHTDNGQIVNPKHAEV